MKIRELLSRRNDLSTFVVHLTRDWTDVATDGEVTYSESAAEAFGGIIDNRKLSAVSPMGFGLEQDEPGVAAKQTQRVVCFSETPLEHTWAMCTEIEDRVRKIKLQPYGLALPKTVARRHGANPVWYVDMTPGHDWLAKDIWALRDAAIATGDFHSQPIARLLPFFDWMGGPFPERGTSAKEFWWEREWRHQGDFSLEPVWSKLIWLCPHEEHATYRSRVEAATPAGETASTTFLDPRWGLEEIVAHLSGLPQTDVSVFAAAEAYTDPSTPPPEA